MTLSKNNKARAYQRHPEYARLDALLDRFGVDTDTEIARKAEVPRVTVTNYRCLHRGLPRSSPTNATKRCGERKGQLDGVPLWLHPARDRLGMDTDAAIARDLGRRTGDVNYWRLKAGLAKAERVRPQTPKRPRDLPAWLVSVRERLGVDTDTQIAKTVGRSHQLVSQWRTRLGIPPKAPSNQAPAWLSTIQARLGVDSDPQIAKEIGRTPGFVRYWRDKLGIPKFKPEVQEIAWQDAIRDRFGIVPDLTLAREVGQAQTKVSRYRVKLGIPCAPSSSWKPGGRKAYHKDGPR